MRDVGIIAGEVHQEDVALVGAVLHEILVQMRLEASPVEGHAFVLLRGAVVVDQVLADGRRQHLVAEQVVDSLVHHRVAGYVAQMPALVYRELVARVWLVVPGDEVLPDVGGGQQVVHLEQLGAVFELAALHRLGPGVINVISVKIYSHIKTTR